MTKNKTMFFEDLSVFNFRQLKNGHWVGENFFGCFTSVESFDKGSTNDERFKHLECRESTEEEETEWDQLGK